jgi:hypothetical protein
MTYFIEIIANPSYPSGTWGTRVGLIYYFGTRREMNG